MLTEKSDAAPATHHAPTPGALDDLICYFEGEWVPMRDATVSIMTHAFMYGTATFEGIRAYWNTDQKRLYGLRIQDHVERIIPLHDILLMPSEMEAFGLAALEAMACGVPPVATRVGGTAELISHEVDGYLEPVGDIDAQAARVVSLLTDDKLYSKVSAAARHAAETRYSTASIIPQYEKYYAEVCG